jgi:hypothetical protein
MSTPLTVTCTIHVDRTRHGRKVLWNGPAPTAPPPGRIPRISRLMALAHRFDDLIRTGQVKDAATLARVGRVTRARISQIMSLLNLAPDIQEQLLFLPKIESGKDRLCLRDLMPIAMTLEWKKQRRLWQSTSQSVAR